MRSRTSATISPSTAARGRAEPAFSTRKPSGTSPFRASLMPITAHSATSGWARQHLLHATGRQAVTRHVDDVVGAAHDPDVAVGVDRSRHRRSRRWPGNSARQVAVHQRVPSCAHSVGRAARRQRQREHQRPHGAGRHLGARLVHGLEGVARHRHGRRARLDCGSRPEARRVAGDAPARSRSATNGPPPAGRSPARPSAPWSRIGPLPGEEQRAEARQVVVAPQHAVGILLADGPEGRGGGEQGRDAMARRRPASTAPASGVPTGLPS